VLLQEHETAREALEAFAPSSFLFLLLLLMLLLQQEMIVNQSIMNAVKEKRTMQSSTFGFAMR
jgi:hypothetical protein